MSRMRFLLDEDTPHSIRDQLLRRAPEIEILAVGDDTALAQGTSDAQLLRWIEQEGYVLVSRNRRTMPQHFREHLEAGGHVPGSFLLRRRHTLGDIIEDLLLLWEASDPAEYRDRIEYLPLWLAIIIVDVRAVGMGYSMAHTFNSSGLKGAHTGSNTLRKSP